MKDLAHRPLGRADERFGHSRSSKDVFLSQPRQENFVWHISHLFTISERADV